MALNTITVYKPTRVGVVVLFAATWCGNVAFVGLCASFGERRALVSVAFDRSVTQLVGQLGDGRAQLVGARGDAEGCGLRATTSRLEVRQDMGMAWGEGLVKQYRSW